MDTLIPKAASARNMQPTPHPDARTENTLKSHTDFKSNIPFEGVAKFNDGFYTIDLRVVILSDNDPLNWDYLALFDEIRRQYENGDYSLEVKVIE